MINIALVEPEIPQNTGNIARTCAATGAKLHLIRPLGFEISDKHVRRTGLDYWQHVRLAEFASWDDFVAERAPRRAFCSSAGARGWSKGKSKWMTASCVSAFGIAATVSSLSRRIN